MKGKKTMSERRGSGLNWVRIAILGLVLGLSSVALGQGAGVTPPLEIQKLLQKAAAGGELTQDEQNKLDAWSESLGDPSAPAIQTPGGTTAPPRPGGLPPLPTLHSSIDDQGVNPCPAAPLSRAPAAAVPDQKAYVALVGALQDKLKAKLTPAQRQSLEQNLDTTPRPQDASNVGLLLLTQARGSAGTYAISKSALKVPTDPVYAANLGVALRGLHDFANAEKMLLYAASLDKKSAQTQANLGWLATDQKRMDAAQSYFKAALALNPKSSLGQSGMGLLQLCGGHPRKALASFQASLRSGFTDFAKAGLETSEGVLGQTPAGQAALAQTPPLFPDVKGVQAGDDVYWKLPPFESDPLTDIKLESKDALLRYEADVLAAQKQTSDRAVAAALADKHNLDRAPTKARFVLRDIQRLTSARLDAPLTALVQAQLDASADLERIQSSATSFACSAVKIRREQALAVHTRFFPVYAASVHQIDAVLSDMWALGSPWIARMKYNSDQEGENLTRVSTSSSAFVEAAQEARIYEGWLRAAMDPDFIRDADNHDCPLGSAQVLHPLKLGKLKTFPDKACNLPTESMSLILASYQADCTGIHLSFGEGARLKFDYTFGKDWASDSLTIGGGAGFVASTGVAGSVGAGANAEVGSYITFTGIGKIIPAFDNATSAAGVQNLADTAKAGAQAFANDPAKYVSDYGTTGTAKLGLTGGDIAKVELTFTEKLSSATGFSSAVSNSSGLGPNANFSDLGD
jgi:tetratricopeptide (TPR) repeat protein